MRILFQISLSQNLTILTPVVTSLTQNWVKNGPDFFSCTNCDRKMKVNSKGKLEVRISFLKAVYQNFEVLTPLYLLGVVINPKMGQKSGISFTNIDRKMKIKTKRYFDRSNDYS